jgi:hypothetical protein
VGPAWSTKHYFVPSEEVSLFVTSVNIQSEMYSKLEYTYFSNAFSVILHALLALIQVHCYEGNHTQTLEQKVRNYYVF